MDEKAYDEICQYLLSKQYPTGATKNDKRPIREKSASFVVTENVLYHKGYKEKYSASLNMSKCTTYG